MFKKCLKYDLRSIFSVWWIGAAVLIAFAVPAGLSLRSVLANAFIGSPTFAEDISALFISLFLILAASFSFFSDILICLRYYRHFYTDEGYLTFTLPVKRSTLFNSKLVSAVITKLASFVILAFALFLLLLISGSDLLEFFTEFLSYSLDSESVILFILKLLTAVLSSLLALFTIFFVITLVNSFLKKHRLLAGVGIMYVLNTVAQQFTNIYTFILMDQEPYTIYDPSFTFSALTEMFIILAIITATALLYNLTLSMLKRRLDLQ
jgi:hypothetical protein